MGMGMPMKAAYGGGDGMPMEGVTIEFERTRRVGVSPTNKGEKRFPQ